MNDMTIKGKWLEIRGDLQKTWGKLTNDELDQTKGDAKAITGLLFQRYGQAQENYAARVAEVLNRFEEQKEKAVETIKEALKK